MGAGSWMAGRGRAGPRTCWDLRVLRERGLRCRACGRVMCGCGMALIADAACESVVSRVRLRRVCTVLRARQAEVCWPGAGCMHARARGASWSERLTEKKK